ncbi:MAG: rod shape-determining protein MreC [Clostridiales bacterium]|jgi:rod shape-determining protein MreC|nr:rod shape-determining protein MreC [Clostridiales bacterium]
MDFLHRHKKYLIIGLAAFSFMAMAYSARDNYRPGPVERGFGFVITHTQGFFMAIGDWVAGRIDFFVNMGELHTENTRLREQVLMYQIENARLLHLEEQIAELSELLDIYNRYADYPVLGATIISQDPSNWFDTFKIDRGLNSGLARDMAVLAPGGLGGRIFKVGYNYAVVHTLVEDNSSVSAQSRRSGDWGMVRGDITLSSHGLLRMEFIDETADIVVGDEVVTSATSSIFPPGIHIGYVEEITQLASGMRSALVRPSVDFTRPSRVLVITELFTHEFVSAQE